LTLPDDGSYSYWIQSRNGTVSVLPANVSHQETVIVRVPLEKGDRLVLLDASTGQWAEQVVTMGADGKPAPIGFALGDFHPLVAPVQAAPISPAAVSSDIDTGSSRLLTGLISLAVAVVAGGFLWHLMRTRGEPLRHLAHRIGIATTAQASSETERDPGMILMPGHHGPNASPEGRFVSAGHVNLKHGPEMPLAQPATLIGVQGLAAGSTFALTAGDVAIGRDGENEIVLAENTVSRYHARLLRQDNGHFALTDLGSANGVYVNGTRVQRAILRSGDQIKVGDNFFRFQMNDGTH